MKTIKIKLCFENDFNEIDLLVANHILNVECEIDETYLNCVNELLMSEYKKGFEFYGTEIIKKINQ